MEFISIGYDFHQDRNFQISRPQGLNHYLFLIIRSNAYYLYNGNKKFLHQKSIILFDKGTPQFFGAIDDDYINDWISFSLNKDEDLLFRSSGIKINKFYNIPSFCFFEDIINLMSNVFNLNNNNIKNAYNSLLSDLLTAFFKKYMEISFSDNSKLLYYNELATIRRMIYKFPTGKYTIESLAHKSNLSISHFSHLYKKYFHTTPINDVILSRIQYAKQLLNATNYSISEISNILNYSCDTQFMKQFKNVVKMTPREYRKNMIN